jgi:hypothetical protein
MHVFKELATMQQALAQLLQSLALLQILVSRVLVILTWVVLTHPSIVMMEMHALSTLATTQLVVWTPLLIVLLNTRILQLTKQIQLLSTVFHSFVIQKLVVSQLSKLAMTEINVPLIPAIKPLELAWTLKSLAFKIQMINAAPLYVTPRLVVSNKLLSFAMMEIHAQMILAILSLEPVFTLQSPVLLLLVVV